MKFNTRVKRLTEEEACVILCDARIVGIRWDIVPWSMVLDLDVRVSEEEGAQVRRVWVAFSGVSTLSLSLTNARLPTGLFVTSEMWVDELPEKGLRKASFRVLYAESSDEGPKSGQTHEVIIVAQKILGVASTGSCSWKEEETGPTWKQRRSLANDDELREFLYRDER